MPLSTVAMHWCRLVVQRRKSQAAVTHAVRRVVLLEATRGSGGPDDIMSTRPRTLCSYTTGPPTCSMLLVAPMVYYERCIALAGDRSRHSRSAWLRMGDCRLWQLLT